MWGSPVTVAEYFLRSLFSCAIHQTGRRVGARTHSNTTPDFAQHMIFVPRGGQECLVIIDKLNAYVILCTTTQEFLTLLVFFLSSTE